MMNKARVVLVLCMLIFFNALNSMEDSEDTTSSESRDRTQEDLLNGILAAAADLNVWDSPGTPPRNPEIAQIVNAQQEEAKPTETAALLDHGNKVVKHKKKSWACWLCCCLCCCMKK